MKLELDQVSLENQQKLVLDFSWHWVKLAFLLVFIL